MIASTTTTMTIIINEKHKIKNKKGKLTWLQHKAIHALDQYKWYDNKDGHMRIHVYDLYGKYSKGKREKNDDD